MGKTFDIIVVGAGLLGASAARHAAENGLSVLLIGPSEPVDKSKHEGLFSSHYDQGRITRQLDTNKDWSLLTKHSIERYASIEAESRMQFSILPVR